MRYISAVCALALTTSAVSAFNFSSIRDKISLRQGSTPMETEFYNFISKFGRSYRNKEEFEKRFALFTQAYNEIQEHNALGLRYKQGINQFSDLTVSEFESLLGNWQFHGDELDSGIIVDFDVPADAPANFDWRDLGAVTPMKNQGSCGGCWSFSAAEGIEGAYFLKTGKLEKFSNQQFLDCSHEMGNAGCGGGFVIGGFYYAMDHAIALDSDYPFTESTGDCYDSEVVGVTTVDSAHMVKPRDQYALQGAVLQQPISISLQANKRPFKNYAGGILDDENCGGEQLNHAILLVGYGEEDGVPFWTLKNQWGLTWGEAGYARILRTDGMGICGMQRQNPFPVIN